MRLTIRGEDVESHVRAIWSDTLGIEVLPALFVEVGGCLDFLSGIVRIKGDWQGAVELRCHESAAWLALNAMAPLEDSIASHGALVDIVAELTNMTAGGIRALIEGSCDLSVPEVASGSASCPTWGGGHVAIAEFGFLCGGEPVFVRLLERAD
ncbi:MAG: chemotaxis protein CheX [Planctomycetes bacterium]|nr:chemotaxis protein CheX [Planctomycetota bacterium]